MLKLDINLLWTVVNVLVMYAVLRKFLFKPVQDVLDKRQKMVDDELANAQDAKTKAEAALVQQTTSCTMWTLRPLPPRRERTAGRKTEGTAAG